MKTIIISSLVMFGIVLVPLSASAYALVDINTAKTETATRACEQNGGTESKDKDGNTICSKGSDITSIFRTVANILLFLVGAIAVIMLIIGGFRYVVSNGDANAISGAKNTIMYAIIGIIVAFLAYAAVNFVTDQLIKGTK